jgi:MFS family permease
MTRASGSSTLTILGISAAVGLVPLNSTMIAVALPKIAEDFGISTGRTGVLVTVYLVAMLVGQPLAGRLGDAIGNRRMVDIALLGVIVCSAAAAAATSFVLLLLARVAQAVFAAALGPSIQSLLRAITPDEQRGHTFGLMGSVLGAGAASGPVIGGVLTQVFGWQAIFLVNIPIALVALVVAVRITTPAEVAVDPSEHRSVVGSGRIANPVFAAAFSLQALSTVAQYALLLLTPIILHARGWESGATGAVLSALTVGMIVMSPIGGRFGDRFGRRAPSLVGLVTATVAVVTLLIAGPDVLPVVLVVGLAVFGLGLGTTTPSLMTAALESVPMHRTGAAAGVLSMSRYVGSIATSISVSALVASDASGSRSVLAIAAVSMAIAVSGTIVLPGNQR